MYELRPYQQEAVSAVFAHLRDAFGTDEHGLVVMPTGCHAPGTMILMADGSSKSVECVAVGDEVMGPDSRPRRVLQLATGEQEMFRITPKRGAPFVVNSDHVLSLKTTNEGKHSPCSTRRGTVENVTVSDYLTRTKSWKHLRKLYRVPVDFAPGPTPPVDPWLLGVLLGDGCTVNGVVSICNPDQEVIEEVVSRALSLGLRPRVSAKKGNPAKSINLSDPRARRGRPNVLTAQLRDLGIMGCAAAHKFVPDIYRTGSRATRREVLAGLLDTDGHLSGKCFDFISKSPRLADDVAFLARSLGLCATTTPCEKWCQSGAGGTYWRVGISGNTDWIPTRIARKRAAPRNQRKDPLVTGFRVEPLGVGRFYGFRLSGDHLYLTEDFFVHHNSGKSVVIAEIVRQILHAEPRSRIVCATHVKELVEQNADKATALGIQTGIYSAGLGRREVAQPFTMASVQSIYRNAEALGHVHVLMIDECHRIPKGGAGMYHRAIDALKDINPDLVVLGFTATPYRADGSGYLHTGDDALFRRVIYDLPMEDLVAEGWLARPSTKRTIISYDLDGVATRAGDYAKGDLERAIASQGDVTRDALAEATRRAADRKHWLVFGVSVAHAHLCAEILSEFGVECGVVTGDTPPAEREQLIERYRSGDLRALANVFVLTTGFDAPETDCLVILRPTKSVVLWVQMVGRGMRPVYGPDPDDPSRSILTKPDCLVLDYGENVWRLGTVASPIVRTSSSDGTGLPPMRSCPECEEMMPAGKRECPGCGYVFPAPQSKVSDRATENSVYVDAEPEEWEVLATTYREHVKPGKPPSMRVSYQVGLSQSYSEWICFEHEGFARMKALKWWISRGGSRPEPETVVEALDRAYHELRTPGRIWIRHEKAKDSEKRYARVIRAGDWSADEATQPITPDECPF